MKFWMFVEKKISISKLFCSSESLWLIFLALFIFFLNKCFHLPLLFSSNIFTFPDAPKPAGINEAKMNRRNFLFHFSFLCKATLISEVFLPKRKIAENCCITFFTSSLLSRPRRRRDVGRRFITSSTQTCHATTMTQTNETHLSGSRSQSNTHHKPKKQNRKNKTASKTGRSELNGRSALPPDLFNLHV